MNQTVKTMNEPKYPYELDELKLWAETYWKKEGEHAKAYYLESITGFAQDGRPNKSLLEVELECAEFRQNCLPEFDARPVTLVILVGTSFEPLLQSIWVYKPTRLVPVVNEFYGDREGRYCIPGKQQWQQLYGWIVRLLNKRPEQLQGIPKTVTPKEDNPTAVFNFLRDELKDDLTDAERRVVIDISGAKKTMVAGAFLLAAYTNAEITYVDFDSYDEKGRRPYGFSCRLVNVRNPFQEWALRDWERAAQLYTQYDFGGALAALPQSFGGGTKTWEEELQALQLFLTICNLWENGGLRQAKQDTAKLPDDLQEHVPLAISSLSGYWPELATTQVSVRFLLNPRALMIYGKDELARTRRLLGSSASAKTRSDHRAAFARAYALYETLLKARVMVLYIKGKLKVKINSNEIESNRLPRDVKRAGLRWLLKSMMSSKALELIRSSNIKKIGSFWGVINESEVKPKLWRSDPNSPVYEPHKHLSLTLPEYKDFTDNLRYTRNLITHTYVPVDPTDADRAIRMAEANLWDYIQNWGEITRKSFKANVKFADSQFAVPDWKTIIEKCKLDFIPESRA